MCLPSHPKVCCCLVSKSCPTLCNPMDCVAHQAPLSMEFPRQEYCSGLPFPSLRGLPSPGVKPMSPALSGEFCTTVTRKAPECILLCH